MLITTKLVYKEVLTSVIKVIFFFSLIIFFFKFIDELEKLGRGEYNIESALIYSFLMFPSYINLILFTSFITGVVIAYGGLVESKTTTILQLGFIPNLEIIKRSAIVSAIAFLILSFLVDFFVGQFEKFAYEYRQQKFGESISSSYDKNVWFKQGENIINIKKNIGGEKFENIFLIKKDKGSINSIAYADSGYINDANLVLSKAQKINIDKRNDIYSFLTSNSSIEKTNISLNKNELNLFKNKHYSLNFLEKLQKIIFLKNNGVEATNIEIDIMIKVISPIVLFSSIIISLLMIFRENKAISISRKIFQGILIGFAINFLFRFLVANSTNFDLNIYVSLSVVTFLFLLTALYFIRFKNYGTI